MIINIIYYLIFTCICLIIPVIVWLFWIVCTLLIIAYNFLITGNKSKKDKEEIERYKKELEKNHKNKDFWN